MIKFKITRAHKKSDNSKFFEIEGRDLEFILSLSESGDVIEKETDSYTLEALRYLKHFSHCHAKMYFELLPDYAGKLACLATANDMSLSDIKEYQDFLSYILTNYS